MARSLHKAHAGRRSSWRQSLLFNSLLLLIPVLASQLMAGAFTAESVGETPDMRSIEETRREIDAAFSDMASDAGDRRRAWARRIAREIDDRDATAARGFLLAAPDMLDRGDRRALLAAAEAEPGRDGDERLARAAILFLPNDVRAEYERSIRAKRAPETARPETPMLGYAGPTNPMLSPVSLDTPADDLIIDPENENDLPPAPEHDIVTNRLASGFSMLGDGEDLARRSLRWLNGEPIAPMQLKLSAIGLMQEAGAEGENLILGASVLKSGLRAGRLQPDYVAYLEERTETAIPSRALSARLENAYPQITAAPGRVDVVLDAYRAAASPADVERVGQDLSQVGRLAELTSAEGALTVLEAAASPDDVRRLRLVAEAGGDRAVALAKTLDGDAVALAQLGVNWSRSLVLQLVALGLLAGGLLWTTLSAYRQADPFQTRRR